MQKGLKTFFCDQHISVVLNVVISIAVCFGFIFSGCGSGSTTTQQPGGGGGYRPPCIGETLSQFLIDYNYMKPDIGGLTDSMDLFRWGYGYTYNAYHSKGNINPAIMPTIAGTGQTYQIINTGTGTLSAIRTAFTNYTSAHHNYDYWGYLSGIDSVTNDQVGFYGLSARGDPRWSFIQVGVVRREHPSEAPEEWISGLVVHELGHQIALVGHDSTGHGWHSGHDSAHCIMDWVSNNNKGYGIFCDAHICTLYAAGTLTISQQPVDRFNVNVSLSKTQYLESEEIWVNLTFKNISDGVDSLNHIAESDISERLNILNKLGIRAYYNGVFAEPRGNPYVKFRPGETKSFSIPVLDDYGYEKEQNGFRICAMNYYFPEDKYSIQYRDNINGIMSNKSEFEVKKASGYDSVAREKLKIIYNINTKAIGDNYLEKIVDLRNFAYAFKKSVYSETAFYLSSLNITLSSSTDNLINESYIEDCNWFIDIFPNSYYIKEIIWDGANAVSKVKKNKTEISKFLNDIIAKYPNTKASENASAYLNYDF